MAVEFEICPNKELFVYVPNEAHTVKIVNYLLGLREPQAEYYPNWNEMEKGDKERGKYATGYSWLFNAGPEMLRKLQARFPTQFTYPK